MEWLDSASRGGRDGTVLFPFWGWLVGLAGKDVAAIGAISVVAGMACVWLVAAIFGAIFGAAVRKAESLGVKNEFPFVESAAALLAGLSFALTPGFLAAATRISPLMVAQIIANAEEGGRVAIASDGVLDELFFFTLPEDIKLISLSRERDPAYGRELATWVVGIGTQLPLANADSSSDGCGGALGVTHPADTLEHPTAPQPTTDGQQSADQLWDEARKMPHNFIPDPVKDGDYLAKIYGAAKLGYLEAMAKLGEYAFRRKALVEVYYWTALAELKGAKGLERTLRNIRSVWLAAGCPAQHGNAYDGFSELQGSFARALRRIHCAVDRPVARARMRELAEQGCAEAQLFLAEMAWDGRGPYLCGGFAGGYPRPVSLKLTLIASLVLAHPLGSVPVASSATASGRIRTGRALAPRVVTSAYAAAPSADTRPANFKLAMSA